MSSTMSVNSETNVGVHYSSPKPHRPDLYTARALRVDKIRGVHRSTKIQ